MAVLTRIKNNQVTDASAGNVYLGVNAAAKVQDYSITAGKIQNNLTYGSDLTITGNLTVQGNTTTIDTVNLVVEDPLILLAKEQTGSPTLDIGFIGKRGTSDNIAWVWDESANSFVSVFTTSEVTNTTITISSYAAVTTANLTATTGNFSGNVQVANLSVVGNISGTANFSGNVTASNFLTTGLVSATGNVTGGNVNTGGDVSATGNVNSGNVNTAIVSASGNVTGANLVTGGLVIATGNITGGNVLTGGLISATGNVDSGNVNTGIMSASGNVTGANLATGGVVTATGNVTGGNLNTGGAVSATGNVTSGNVNTGIISASGNVNGTGAVFSGNVTAQYFFGNIAGNIDAAGSNTQVQFNNDDLLGASSNFTFDKATNILAVGGQITSTGAGNAATGTGQIFLNGATLNRIDYNTNGTGAPAFTTRSNGTKVTLYPALSGSTTDYALGIDAATMWYSIPEATSGFYFKWYGATTEVANLSGTGIFSATGNIIGANILTSGYVTATGNVTGGNVNTGGAVSATGNVDSGNVNTGIMSASGNVTGANLVTGGLVTATGNVTGGNVNTGGDVSATGNVNSGNVNTGIVSASGNVTGANVTTGGLITATGNVTGGNLTTGGVVSATGNINSGANIVATANVIGGNLTTAGLVSATGNVTGGNITTGGAVSATGNVNSGNVNTGIMSASGNVTGANVATTGLITATGNVTAGNVNTGIVSASGNIVGPNIVTTTVTTSSGDLVLNSAGGALQWDGSGNIVMNSQWINGLSDPVQAFDAATKQYVDDAVSSGIHIHTPVYVETPTALPSATYAQGGNTFTVTDTVAGNTVVFSTAANLQVNDQLWFTNSFNGVVGNLSYFVVSAPNTSAAVLSTAYNGVPVSNITTGSSLTEAVRVNSGIGATLTATANGALTIDSVSVTATQRVLVYQQANAVQNGVYVVTDAGNVTAPWILTRSSDTDTYEPDTSTGLDQGSYFYVQAGATGAGESYVKTAPAGPFIFGYANIEFTQFGASQVYSANTAAGIDLTGTVFSAKVDNDTTAFDGGGNISVKAGANLVTPNIGAATGTSLSVTGNVTGGNLNTGGAVSATGNVNSGNVNTAIVSATGNVNSGNVNTTLVSATGNVIGGNVSTAGVVTATGNVTGGNVLTGGIVSATGNIDSGANIVATANVIGGNITTAGVVTATGNVTGGNLVTGGLVQATGNVNSGNVNTTIVSATGNVIGGNVSTAGVVTATGNVTGGNIDTAGVISATGNVNSGANIVATANVIGGNITTAGVVTATGNVAGGNINTGGAVSATGNVNSGNVNTTLVSATGNVVAGNVSTAGLVTATGNVTGGNLVTGGEVSATGNVTSGNVNTGIVSATGNVAAVGFTGGNVSVTGNVYATNFIGNISGNIDAAGANTEVQFNNNDLLGASANFTFNSATNVLTVTGDIQGTTVSATGNVIGGNVSTAGVVTATGNVTGGNVNTGGAVSATGNVNSGNVNTGIMSASGNVTGANISTAGLITATGNVTGGNVSTAGLVTATGNVTGGNVSTAGLVTATGNVTGGNVLTGGLVSATGNITAANLILTSGTIDGPAAGRITINASDLDTDFAIDGDSTPNIFYVDAGVGTASFGNSGAITNAIVSFNTTDSIKMPVGNTAQRPDPATVGMLRFTTASDALEIYTSTGWELVGVPAFTVITDDQFSGTGACTTFTLSEDSTTAGTIVSINGVVQIPTTAYSVTGNSLVFTEAPEVSDTIDARILTTTTSVTSIQNSSGNAVVEVLNTADTVQITGNLLPSANVTYDLGSNTMRWNDAYFNGTSITLGNVIIKNNTGNTIGFFGPDGTTPATIDSTNIDTTTIANGTSNMAVIASGGNIRANVGGATVQTISSGGVEITGNLSVTGNATLSGNILGDRIQNGTTTIDIQSSGGNANISVGGTNNVGVFATTGLFVTGVAEATGNITGGNLITAGLVSLSSITKTGSNGVGNIGSSTSTFNTIFAKATSAQYADLAEMYVADQMIEPGTVVCFGGDHEVTICDQDSCSRVAGVISTNPSYIMNAGLAGDHVVAVALTGRVPTRVTGQVRKGDMMVSTVDGRARACATPAVGQVIGKALADFDGTDGVIEVVVGRL